MVLSRSDVRAGRGLLAFLLTLFLAVWVGGSILTDLILIPGAFRTIPREHAMVFGAAAFAHVNLLECLLGAASVLIAFVFGRAGWGTLRRHWTATFLLLGMTAFSLLFLLYLTPYITSKAEALLKMGIDLDDLTIIPPEREDLHTAHMIYALLDGLKIAAGVAVLWLLSSRRNQ
jgi:Domain of unknown function (DUF4149)